VLTLAKRLLTSSDYRDVLHFTVSFHSVNRLYKPLYSQALDWHAHEGEFMESGQSNNPNLEDLMRLGVTSAKAGNKDNARVIFQRILSTDKRHVGAWLWMAYLADDNVDRRRYLETVLRLDPTNNTARKQLASLDRAVERGENRSVRFGVMILLMLIIVLIVVGGIILLVSKFR
jgi:hypothetical protein